MKTAIALGTFDGVHIGHRQVLSLPQDCRRIAVTFNEPPKSVMTGVYNSIMTNQMRFRIMREIGIEKIVALDFNSVRNLEPGEFLKWLYDEYKPSLISCGFNYSFGLNSGGDAEYLGSFCKKYGIEFRCCEPVRVDGQTVSSTLIRSYLSAGDIEAANRMLGSQFSYTGEVIKGDRRGRTIGFPTVNQKYPQELVKIKFGVYRSHVKVEDNIYEGITNIGVRPTYPLDYVISETYIIGFSGDLYGRQVTILPQRFLRGEVKFSSLDDLKRQIELDINS